MKALILAAAFSAAVHGNVVSVDRAHDLVLIHHHAHAGMAMEMTMAIRLRDARQLRSLITGQYVTLRCDPRSNPYVCVRV